MIRNNAERLDEHVATALLEDGRAESARSITGHHVE
jgi:hypothetical protein